MGGSVLDLLMRCFYYFFDKDDLRYWVERGAKGCSSTPRLKGFAFGSGAFKSKILGCLAPVPPLGGVGLGGFGTRISWIL